MKSHLLNILKFAIGWPLSIIALYFIYTTFAGKVDDFLAVTHVHYGSLAAAFICFIIYYFLRSYIWLKLLQYLGHAIPFRESSYLWLSAQLKRYIPGNIWSFLGLAVSYGERKVTKKDLAIAVLIESELVIIVTFILSLLSFPFIARYFIHIPFSEAFILQLLTVLFFAGALFYIYSSLYLKYFKGKMHTVLKHIFPPYAPSENTKLLFLMGAAYIFYGFGYYFSVSALIPLDPSHMLTYIGIFIFSLVAGYLSIITPTGLGVREGFITLGLSKFIPLGVAGLAAIFSRVIIVASEIIALVLSYAWFRVEKKFLKQERWLASHVHEIILSGIVTLYILYFTIISFLRYVHYYTGRFDLGNMAQTVWNTLHGRIFMITDPNGTEIISRLAFHADFILILLAPFYGLWQDPRMLLLIQSVVVGLGGVFLYLIAKDVLKDKTVSLIISVSYLLNPSVQRANLYDFHAVVLATTLLLGAVYFLLNKRFTLFLVFAILTALTKEQLWFTIALFGPILYVVYKKRLLGATVFIISLGIFYYVLWVAIPQTAGSSHFALSYFSDGGESPSDIVKHILFSPVESFQTFVSPSRLAYYEKLLMPLGFLPLFFPLWLIPAAPDLVLNIFSDRSQLQQIYYQYTAVISAFLFLSLVYAIPFLRKYVPRISLSVLGIYILIAALIGAYRFGPLPGSKEPNLAMITQPQKDRVVIDHELATIPREASVSASNNLASHLSERERVYVIPRGIDHADYIAIYKTQNNTNDKESQTLEIVRSDSSYEKYFENNSIVLFKKKYHE